MKWPSWITGRPHVDELREEAEHLLRAEIEEHRAAGLNRLRELTGLVETYQPPGYERVRPTTRVEIEAYRAEILRRLHDLEDGELHLGVAETTTIAQQSVDTSSS